METNSVLYIHMMLVISHTVLPTDYKLRSFLLIHKSNLEIQAASEEIPGDYCCHCFFLILSHIIKLINVSVFLLTFLDFSLPDIHIS